MIFHILECGKIIVRLSKDRQNYMQWRKCTRNWENHKSDDLWLYIQTYCTILRRIKQIRHLDGGRTIPDVTIAENNADKSQIFLDYTRCNDLSQSIIPKAIVRISKDRQNLIQRRKCTRNSERP